VHDVHGLEGACGFFDLGVRHNLSRCLVTQEQEVECLWREKLNPATRMLRADFTQPDSRHRVLVFRKRGIPNFASLLTTGWIAQSFAWRVSLGNGALEISWRTVDGRTDPAFLNGRH
jgi:hypothetical protein